jgi:hypothetical protein
MLHTFVHAPDLTEVGCFYLDSSLRGLQDTEKILQTQFAFATTTPSQAAAEKTLRDGGWRDLGHRYNQFHGPNFITLWFKEFPANTSAAKPQDPRTGDVYEGGPKGIFSCGIWVEAQPFGFSEAYLKTKYLAVWRMDNAGIGDHSTTLAAQGWQCVGCSHLGGSIWHTAEPHSIRDKHLDYKPANFYGGRDTR